MALLRHIAEKGLRESKLSPADAARVISIGTQMLRAAAAFALFSAIDPLLAPLPLRIAAGILGVVGIFVSAFASQPTAAILASATEKRAANRFAIGGSTDDIEDFRAKRIVTAGAMVLIACYVAVFIVAAYRNPRTYWEWILITAFMLGVGAFTRRRSKSSPLSPEELVREQPGLSIEHARSRLVLGRVLSVLLFPAIVLIAIAFNILLSPTHKGEFVNAATDARTISARFPGSVLVPTSVNGHALWFALDTTDQRIDIDRQAATNVGLRPNDNGSGTANFTAAGMQGNAIQFGPTNGWKARDGTSVSGLLGAPLFEAAAISIDFQHNELVIYPKGGFHSPSTTVAVPITFFRGIPVVDVQVDGQKHAMLLDTRLYRTTILDASARAPHVVPVAISFGGRTFPHRPIFEAPPAFWAGTKVEGWLCRDILQYFRITFDYANKVVYLER
jgi:hypothetical protein